MVAPVNVPGCDYGYAQWVQGCDYGYVKGVQGCYYGAGYRSPGA
jgi:hypothetical protein